jgi:tRNA-guanine transglycosylase
MKNFEFKIVKKDKQTKARAGIFKTPNGIIETPMYVPVGTQASVKSLTPKDLKEIGVQIFFGNTYHLHLRPGEDLIQKFGGLAKFMSWNGPTMTDSGGFQVFSLAGTKRSKNSDEEAPTLVKITEDGVKFRSHLDGSLNYFTPEESIGIQHRIGADLILAFDDCPPYPATHEKVEKAVERTHKWAVRSVAFHRKQKTNQFLYGITQGGIYKDLREKSAKFISSLSFDGIAIGGVAVGESKKEMINVLNWSVPHSPDEKPRHLLGVGEIDDVFEIVERGIDTFDCVIPTRLGRTGFIFVSPKEGNLENRFRIDIQKTIWKTSKLPLDKNCNCYVCKNFTRAYVHHLFRARELLAYRLASYHNIHFVIDLSRKIRLAILEDSFSKVKKEWLGKK